MSFEAQLSTILDLLYEAPGDAIAWNAFLKSLASVLRSDTASLVLFDERNRRYNIDVSEGVPMEARQLYEQRYAAVDEWYLRAKGRVLTGFVADGQALCPTAELVRTEFYNDFLRRFKWLHECAAVIESTPSAIAALALLRTARHHEFSSDDIQLISHIAPHIQRALKLHRKMLDLRLRDKASSAAMDHVPFGVVLLRENGAVVLANNLAAAMCNGDGVIIHGGSLHAVIAAEDHALQALIRRARYRPVITSPPHAIKLSRKDGSFLIVSVAAMRVPIAGLSESAIAVFIHDMDRRRRFQEDVLRLAYGLTVAECRLAHLCNEGSTPAEASERLSVSTATVRSQLSSIFAKTGTRRQSELVLLLSKLPINLDPKM